MDRLSSIALVITASILLGACGATMQISPEKKSAIYAVTVSDRVAVTDEPRFISGIGHLLAPGIGGEIEDKDQQYVAFLKAARIDIASIVKSVFEAQLSAHPVYGPKVKPNAPYRFELEVPFHALVQKTSITNYYRANVSLRIKLVGPNGEVLGKGRAQSCIFGDCVPLHKLDEIRSNPAFLKLQYEAAVKDAIRQVLEGL